MRSTPPPDEPIRVVIVHRHRPQAAVETIDRLSSQGVATDVVLVDNGSTPDEIDQIRTAWPNLEMIVTGANLGYGPGANVGLRRWLRAGAGEWIVVAPHDADPDLDTLKNMLNAVADRPRAGLFSADVGDGQSPVINSLLGAIGEPAAISEGFEPSDYPHGTLLMARRSCLEDIGVFDERYFAYGEEADLGLRAKQAGWEVGIIRGATVRNPGMNSDIEPVAYLQLRNMLLLLRTHYGRGPTFFRATFMFIQLVVGSVHKPARGLHWSPRGRIRGWFDHIRKRYGPPPY